MRNFLDTLYYAGELLKVTDNVCFSTHKSVLCGGEGNKKERRSRGKGVTAVHVRDAESLRVKRQ